MFFTIIAAVQLFFLAICGIEFKSTDPITSVLPSTAVIYPDTAFKHSAPFYFTLSQENTPRKTYYLNLYWINKEGKRNFVGGQGQLIVRLDQKYSISLDPIKPSTISSYNLEQYYTEERLIYKIDREFLNTLANSKKIELVLEGKYRSTTASFNALVTRNMIKQFIKKY